MKIIRRAALLAGCALFLLPFLSVIHTSLSEGIANDGGFPWSLKHYIEILSDSVMLSRFGNSLQITLRTLLIQIPVSLLGGFYLNRRKGMGRNVVLLLFLLAMLMPFQAYMVPSFQLCRQLGLYDTWWAVVAQYAFLPFGSLLMALMMRTVAQEEWEAAKLETSSLWLTYFHLVLPRMLPGIMLLLLYAFSESWSTVEQPLILIKDGALLPISLYLNDIHNQPSGYLSAGAVLFAMPIILMYPLTMRLIKGIRSINYRER